MANVAVAIAMDPTYLPYERPPDPQTLWSAIPRGLRGFLVENGVLTAKPVNDTETLSLTGTLPNNFAYVLAEVSLKVNQDVMDNWRSEFTLNLQGFYQGHLSVSTNWNFAFPTVAGSSGPAGARGNSSASSNNLPRAPMWALAGTSGILISITAHNQNAPAGAAGVVNAYINFWEFDLEQARKYPINAPLPTHSR